MPERRDRLANQLRPIDIGVGVILGVETSILYRCGRTEVLCVATLDEGTPQWLDTGDGWLTAEYSMLPYATEPRNPRSDGKPDGRSQEIRRLIGRALRASVDRRLFPGYTIRLDCDVLCADGGTRTASINGSTIALGLLVEKALADGRFSVDPRRATVLAISAGLVDGEVRLDLDYAEDSAAEIDLNLVGTPGGDLVEVQGSSEGDPIPKECWQQLMELAAEGLTSVENSVIPHIPSLEP
ncbi:MAG TPA: ribonuclease PH [Planctomycetes bacterium]|nr:ribonuclease PH [Planctomycetota bacterium]